MWPTFYIPPWQGYPDFISGNPYELCGVTAAAASVTVPTPPQAITGALHLVVISYGSSPGGTNNFPDAGGPPWRRIFDSDYASAASGSQYGIGKQLMFWRIYTAGDPDFSCSHSPSGFIQCAYTSIILNNPNLSDPWFTLYEHAFAAAGAGSFAGYRWSGASTLMEVANSGDLLLFTSCNNGKAISANEPSGTDVEFSCTPTFPLSGGPDQGHTIAGLQSRAKVVNNFLTYCPSLSPSGWSIVGLSRTFPAPGTTADCAGNVRLTCDTGSGQHYAEQSVTLVAGQSYMFAVSFMAFSQNTPVSPDLWMTYTKPDTTEHGIGTDSAGTPIAVTGSTEVVLNGAGTPDFNNYQGDNSGSIFGGELSFIMVPTVSGTYKFRIYVTVPTSPGVHVQPGGSSASGNANQWVEISGVVLQQGPSKNQMPCFLPTDSAALPVGSTLGVLPPVPRFTQAASNASSSYTMLVMRRSGGIRPRCRFFSPYLRNQSLEFDDNSIVNMFERHDHNVRGYQAIGSSHVVYEYLSRKKYYYEIVVTSVGSGGMVDAYSIGFCMSQALLDLAYPPGGTYHRVGLDAGQYTCSSTGNCYTDGVLDGATTAVWAVGDKIGASIDFTNWEIKYYINGTVVKTQTITNDIRRYALYRAQIGIRGPTTPRLQGRITSNFRGPFGGRKPVGFYALDYDNEVP
jgi:hypothetical protein